MSDEKKKRTNPNKGPANERKFDKELSLWWSQGEDSHIFWRTAGSGARATRKELSCHVGDVAAIKECGKPFEREIVVELKHYREISLYSWLVNEKDQVTKWWNKGLAEAKKHNRCFILIIRANYRKPLVFMEKQFLPPEIVQWLSNHSDVVCFTLKDFFKLDPNKFCLFISEINKYNKLLEKDLND